MILDELQPFAISLLIGLMTGIERERNNAEGEGTMGVRTFAFIALIGTAAATSDSQVLTMGLGLIVAILISLGYWRSTSPKAPLPNETVVEPDMGLSSEFAAALVFALGYLTKDSPFLAGVLGIVLVTILYSRNKLHFFLDSFYALPRLAQC